MGEPRKIWNDMVVSDLKTTCLDNTGSPEQASLAGQNYINTTKSVIFIIVKIIIIVVVIDFNIITVCIVGHQNHFKCCW